LSLSLAYFAQEANPFRSYSLNSTLHRIYILSDSNPDMFHVAARPGQQHHYEMYQHQHPAAPLPNLQLPRSLNRPAFAEVQREAIVAVEPNLGQVPFEYIRRGLHSRGEEYVQKYRLWMNPD
jgi:hypothetical protein